MPKYISKVKLDSGQFPNVFSEIVVPGDNKGCGGKISLELAPFVHCLVMTMMTMSLFLSLSLTFGNDQMQMMMRILPMMMMMMMQMPKMMMRMLQKGV